MFKATLICTLICLARGSENSTDDRATRQVYLNTYSPLHFGLGNSSFGGSVSETLYLKLMFVGSFSDELEPRYPAEKSYMSWNGKLASEGKLASKTFSH